MTSETRTARGAPTAGYLAAYAGLAVLTAVVAVAMVPFNIDLGQELANNPQDDAQLAVQWGESAALGYTSGSEVGWTLALAAGMLARRWAARREMTGAAVALPPGVSLGLVALVAAAVPAMPRLRGLAENAGHGMFDDIGHPLIDPGMAHHPTVVIIMVMTLALYAGSSGVGYAAAGARKPVVLAVLLIPAYLVGSVIVRLGGALSVAPGLFPS